VAAHVQRTIKAHLIPSIIAALAAGVVAQPPQAPEAPPTLADARFLSSPGDGWKLLWHDEFDGVALDNSKWSIGLPWPGTDGTGRHHDDRYASYTLDHNVVVDHGTLKLLTRREDVIAKNGRVFRFTQGQVTTAKNFRHAYGYWEARVKLPTTAGPGLWPAFWTLAEGWPPEMDICEVWTSNNRSHQGTSFRRGRHASPEWDEYNAFAPLPTDWTTYGMEWGPGYQLYNINRRITWRVYGDVVTAEPNYILLNSGVESEHAPTPATTFPNALEVDYVRVYERPDAPVIHNASFEFDDLRPWAVTGRAAIVGYDPKGGAHALRLDGRTSSIDQKLYGLHANTTYTLTADIKSLTPNTEVRLGVKPFDGSAATEIVMLPSGNGYHRASVHFTTGPTSTTAGIFCGVNSDDGAALFDEFTLRPE
jgi:beta-glucanase (GH16 family)